MHYTSIFSKAALKFFCILIIFYCIGAHGADADSDWFLIARDSAKVKTYSVKKRSFEITTAKSGASIALIVGQIENKNTKQIQYGKWYVPTNDCNEGMGKLVLLKINGEFDSEADFVSNGKNIASSIADFICDVYQYAKSTNQKKGI